MAEINMPVPPGPRIHGRPMVRPSLPLRCGFLLLWLLAVASAPAAMDLFLRVEGMPGEAQDAAHTNEIEVLAWSWGAANSGTTQTGGGTGAGVASAQTLNLVKFADRASAPLLQATCNGKTLRSAVLTVRRRSGTEREFYQLALSNVIVTAFSAGGSGGEDRLTENVALTFGQLQVIYQQTLPPGTVGGRDELTWSLASNQVSLVSMPVVAGFRATLTYVPGATSATLNWPGEAGASYEIQFTRTLTAPFKSYTTHTAVENGPQSLLVPASNATGFFRVLRL